MNQIHRNRIDSLCNNIVPKIDIIKLWPKLLENKVYNRDDVNISRWKESLTNKETVRDIYLTIKTRGPLAFDRLLVSLKQSGHENLADILNIKEVTFYSNETEKYVKQDGNTNDNNLEEKDPNPNVEGIQDNFFYNIQETEVPLEINVRKSTNFLDGPEFDIVERYPMRSNPRGLVLLITNIQFEYQNDYRTAALHDEKNLMELFEQMGFKVIPHNNLSTEELSSKTEEFSKLKQLRTVDSAFIIISSHGDINTEYEVTEIHGVDYNPEINKCNKKTVLCRDILNYFTAEACPHLAGKPKVFIFQLCRGKERQKAVRDTRHATDIHNFRLSDEATNFNRPRRHTIRNNQDMLIVHATLPGFVAFRDKIVGSWFLQILCEVFMNYAYNTHLYDLLHMVDTRLKMQRTATEDCQTLMVTSMGFNKHCYLNPGLFENT